MSDEATAARVPATVHALRDKMLTPAQVELLKRTICKGATDDELQMFLYVCTHTGLDPFTRQIHAVKRREKDENDQWRESMSMQVGIDGLRLVAERSGNYAPGPEAAFEYDDEGHLVKATAFVLKYHRVSNTWHTVAASAHYREYAQMRGVWATVQGKRQKTGEEPNRMWAEKPHIMLAKCAEALSLRKAFPAETSGLYIDEEMPEDHPPNARAIKEPEAKTAKGPTEGIKVITEKQRRALFAAGSEAGHDGDAIRDYLKARYSVESSRHVPEMAFQPAIDRLHNTQPLFVDGLPHDPHDEAFKRALPAPSSDDPPEPGSNG